MKKLSSSEIRNLWLKFFKSKGHMIEPGASLIPHNDPTLLWINAGVSALKKYFDGSEMPACKRITNVQKCIRTNDIDNVGYTARHHTFFEMLGNFSIGDYFRKEAIEYAYEILTSKEYFDLPIDKLYATYHPSDLEAKKYWIEQGMSEDHLIPLEGNYWQIGEGPCGPNTEVFFDRGEKYDKDHIGIRLLKEDMENDRYVEIWGIVFSQFNAENGLKREEYKELPHKNIDTGAGLERITCVIQETETNFETDLFYPYIEETMKLCGKPYEGENLLSYRVIADHIRSCTFALADGASFSNEGRGYVLRRVLRRAMRYGQKLGLYEPFLYKLVDKVCENMKSFYPYLESKKDFVKKIIKNEEEKFIKTLTSGEQILDTMINGKKILSGEDAFKLYDTYGFPIELTKEICLDKNVTIDIEKFNECLNKQKELARSSRKNLESFNKQSKDLMEFKEVSIYNYDSNDIEAKVIGLFENGVKVDSINEDGDVIFNETNFYAEMGGQVSDIGFIENNDFKAEVTDVIKAPNKQHLHHIKVLYGTLKVGDLVKLEIDKERQFAIEKNHSATHLLQAALIKVLGDDVKQKGSFVNDEYLRFDFSYFNKVTSDELKKVEGIVNSYINQNYQNNTSILNIEEAKKTGAISLFDEKYGDMVRVVSFGDVSKEFCGGNHVKQTGDIGMFVIKSEGSVASGVRRIEATTSFNAFKILEERNAVLEAIKVSLGVLNIDDIPNKIETLKESLKETNNKLDSLIQRAINGKAKDLLNQFSDKHVLVEYLAGYNKDSLMKTYDLIKSTFDDYIIVLIGDSESKHPIICTVGKSLIEKGIKSKDVLVKVTQILGGSGGGKPELSQGSVDNVSDLKKVVEVLNG